MDFLTDTMNFIILISAVISSAGGIMIMCKKAAKKKVIKLEKEMEQTLKSFRENCTTQCTTHNIALKHLKKADRVILECQYSLKR